MLQNAYLLAKIGADTAENEQHFAEIAASRGGGRSVTEVGLLQDHHEALDYPAVSGHWT